MAACPLCSLSRMALGRGVHSRPYCSRWSWNHCSGKYKLIRTLKWSRRSRGTSAYMDNVLFHVVDPTVLLLNLVEELVCYSRVSNFKINYAKSCRLQFLLCAISRHLTYWKLRHLFLVVCKKVFLLDSAALS